MGAPTSNLSPVPSSWTGYSNAPYPSNASSILTGNENAQGDPTLATPSNIDNLASIIMSEASRGNHAEQVAVGSTVLNRMRRNGTDLVRNVSRGFSHNQVATAQIRQLAKDLLTGEVRDNTGGATNFYSPQGMPRKGQPTAGYDVGGGLEETPGLNSPNYRPGWAATYEPKPVQGVRPRFFRFYEAPGARPFR